MTGRQPTLSTASCPVCCRRWTLTDDGPVLIIDKHDDPDTIPPRVCRGTWAIVDAEDAGHGC